VILAKNGGQRSFPWVPSARAPREENDLALRQAVDALPVWPLNIGLGLGLGLGLGIGVRVRVRDRVRDMESYGCKNLFD
jgi:hypothetical protein